MSYTTFKFSNLSIKPHGTMATVSFDITNTGSRTGKEVTQVYISDTHSKVPCPEEELKGFDKCDLTPGETKHLTIDLNYRAFTYWDVDHHDWNIAPGKFVIGVGDSSASIDFKGNLEISKEAATAGTF